MGQNKQGILVRCDECLAMYRSKNILVNIKSKAHVKKSLNNRWNAFFLRDSQNNTSQPQTNKDSKD
jgi:hypothetical protein